MYGDFVLFGEAVKPVKEGGRQTYSALKSTRSFEHPPSATAAAAFGRKADIKDASGRGPLAPI